MNAPTSLGQLEKVENVQHRHVSGSNDQVQIIDTLDSLIIPLGSITISAFPWIAATEVGTGSLLFIPCNTCHEVRFEGDFNAIVVNSEPSLRHGINVIGAPSQENVTAHAQIVSSPQQINAIVQLIRRLTAASDSCMQSSLRSIAHLLLWEVALSTKQVRNSVPTRRKLLDASKIRTIDQFVEANLEEPLTLGQLAQHAGLSRYYFLRSFKEATGLSPLQYVIGKRVERARIMLRDGSGSIAEVAYATGFSSQSHLNWAFKRHFGVTPGTFKKGQRFAA